MKSFFTPFRVGLVALGGIIAMFTLLSMIGKQRYSTRDTNVYFATFKDATGLSEKSRVQIAGIEVGVIEQITLTTDGKARIKLRIKKEVALYEDARIMKRAISLLGDYLLDIYPGTPGTKRLKDGDEIGRVIIAPGMEDVFAALGDVTRDIQGVVQSIRRLLEGEGEGSIRQIILSMNSVAQGLNRTIDMAGGRLDYILQDAQKLASTVRQLASSEQGNVAQIIANIRTFTEQANRVLASIGQIIGTGQGQLSQSVAGVRDTLAQLQKTLQHSTDAVDSARGTIDTAHDILNRIDHGEGTLGKFVRDDGIAVKLDKTLADVNQLVAPISELQLKVALRDEIHWRPNLPPGLGVQGKAGVSVYLVPRPDKFYGFEVISDPRGYVHQQVVATTDVATGVKTNQVQTYTTNTDLKFSAFLGKRWGPAAFRLGLIESSGGAGADVFAFNDRLRLTVDAFDFSDPFAPYPRVRASANLTLFGHLFLGLGGDDLLNSPPIGSNGKVVLNNGFYTYGRDGFVTAGISFTDDDLKSLITLTGVPKP